MFQWSGVMAVWIQIMYYLAFVIGAHEANLINTFSSKFSSVLDAVMFPIRPLILAGSDKCDMLKGIFGVTYNQIQEKNFIDISELLKLYYITKDGRIQFSFKDTNKLKLIIEKTKTAVIIIHGFMGSSDGLMVQAVADEFLKKDNVSVFALDSSKVISFEYLISTTYARLLGNTLGVFLISILKGKEDALKIYLVGHSLGAHIAGVTGKTVRNGTGHLISRITGLDPAGPCFSNIDGDGRLQQADATFVDVIHTNAGVLGLEEPVGHIDYYPNNGMWQPGCVLVTCDHSRAWGLFYESINSPDHFYARKCSSWTLFKSGQCANNEVALMGVYSKNVTPGTYYLSTGSKAPYGFGLAGSG